MHDGSRPRTQQRHPKPHGKGEVFTISLLDLGGMVKEDAIDKSVHGSAPILVPFKQRNWHQGSVSADLCRKR